MDVSEYRKKIEDELRREPTREEHLREVLDQSTTRGSEGLESASGDDIISATISVALNKDEAPRARVAALSGVSTEIGESPDLIDAVLDLVADRSEPPELRHAALAVLRQNSFRTKLFAPKRADYLNMLRGLVDDPELPLRFSAIEVLAAEKDEYVQRLMREGLEDPQRALVTPEKALEFLSYDIHSIPYPLVREIVENPPSLAAKREAVRLLGTDAASADVLVGLLRDKSEDPEVRNISAAALQSIAPDAFEDMAREIVLDENEDDNLRALGVTALDHFGDRGRLGRDVELNSRINELGSGASTEELESPSGGADSAPTNLERAATRFISRRRR